jgi:hypothetical protein
MVKASPSPRAMLQGRLLRNTRSCLGSTGFYMKILILRVQVLERNLGCKVALSICAIPSLTLLT